MGNRRIAVGIDVQEWVPNHSRRLRPRAVVVSPGAKVRGSPRAGASW
jgi:hypothetical protein